MGQMIFTLSVDTQLHFKPNTYHITPLEALYSQCGACIWVVLKQEIKPWKSYKPCFQLVFINRIAMLLMLEVCDNCFVLNLTYNPPYGAIIWSYKCATFRYFCIIVRVK